MVTPNTFSISQTHLKPFGSPSMTIPTVRTVAIPPKITATARSPSASRSSDRRKETRRMPTLTLMPP